jgi:hypothetical protein
MKKLTVKKLVELSKKTPAIFAAGSLVTALSNAYALTPNTTDLLQRIESRSPTIETAEALVKSETLLFLTEKANQASHTLLAADLEWYDPFRSDSWGESWSESKD